MLGRGVWAFIWHGYGCGVWVGLVIVLYPLIYLIYRLFLILITACIRQLEAANPSCALGAPASADPRPPDTEGQLLP